jgi:hypothetical protein
MSYPIQNGFSKNSGASEAEETLRLIAHLPAPEGLEDRVQAGLRSAPRRGWVLAWPRPLPLAGGWLRAAAAAAIVLVVAGGGWGIYSRVQPGQPEPGVAGPRVAGPGQFSTGEAVRRPQTLVGPVVNQPATVQPLEPKAPVKSIAKPLATPKPSGKSKAVGKTAALPAAPTVQ